MNITSSEWWKAALLRALRTALVVAVPYLGAVKFADIPWLAVASVVGLAFIASLLFSIAGLPELGAGQSLPLALLVRVVKTVAQALLAGIGTSLYIQDVHWAVILQTALLAGLGTLVTAFLAGLPETANSAQQFGIKARFGKAA